ncbi:PHB depolymerase family esterase [Polaromonas sp.]|jgi:poly(hydroxyalkanoate) depolymerase family esterase|uniref:extracellular catalytic domain type 1 short-chain-length polyhydroxyalkanoate depolymerase n=1 Tax=Polaromonas sp. TaxID=1869339 RepID=UPI002CDE5573|nr:PHB depolymerase family esterase [Polaromonas sp.]HQS30309.1 PHB depolymerase family esterase [Polaromonas sp.]HQS89672.1 PHB depolymerase family esterase [Polaromonas sp.]
MSISEIFKATQLTRGGRLMEATRLIQQALGLSSAPAPASVPPRQAKPQKAAGWSRAGSSGDAVDDVPFREIRKESANESAFAAPGGAATTSGDATITSAPVLKGLADAPEDVEAPVVDTPAEAPAARPAPAFKPRPASFHELSFRLGDTSHAYRLYVPASVAPASTGEKVLLPLVVLLHGCKQNAEDFALGTAMNALAEEKKCLVLYPEQSSSANSMRCWNWFDAAHQARDAGEPKMIAALIRKVLKSHDADPSRVYIAGLSAGGAMAALMAGLYPEMFAAVGVHSGLPPGAANDVMSAFSAMRRGARKNSDSLADLQGDDGDAFVMPTIVFHGSADKTVNPDNGEQITDAALAALAGAGIVLKKVEQAEDSPGTSSGRRDTLRTIYSAADGVPYVEYWAVGSGPHAWSGGDAAGSYTDPHGPSASQAMLAFFLQHRREGAAKAGTTA